jgi:hypothetical protein
MDHIANLYSPEAGSPPAGAGGTQNRVVSTSILAVSPRMSPAGQVE